MAERYKAFSAVFAILVREGENGKEILLQKRQNTGWQDGMWDMAASGHVEEGESMTTAVCREILEEIGLRVSPEDVKAAYFCHHKGEGQNGKVYYDGYFKVEKYNGEPKIMEPDKASDLKWWKLKELPEDMIKSRRADLERIFQGEFYGEYGWNN